MTITVAQTLQNLFGPARDQKTRPTCLAFAASDCHSALRGPWQTLSAEYAFFHAQQRAGRRLDQGALLDRILEALRVVGQPVENDWPYVDFLPTPLSGWGPPAGITTLFKREGQEDQPLFDKVLDGLDDGRPVIIGMKLSDSFYAPGQDGLISAPASETPDPTRRHAVVAVAHGATKSEPAVLVRNSWGAAWGQRGYGWLPKSYLEPRIMKIAILLEDPNVYSN